MNMNVLTTDFVILGAGVMGTSIAFQLAKRKAGRIVVIEKEHVGRGASGRSSALVRMHYTFEPEVQLALRSFEMFSNWQEISGGPGDFHRIGFIQLVAEKEIDLLKANVEMQKANGVNVELIDNKHLKLIEPDWYVDDVVLAAYEPESGYGDGAGVANDFLEKAREMGVEYRPRTRATSLLVSRGEVEGVATEHGEIRAPIVIAATGQWTRALLTEADVDLPITTEYHEVAILKTQWTCVARVPRVSIPFCACISAPKATIRRQWARSQGNAVLIPTIFLRERQKSHWRRWRRVHVGAFRSCRMPKWCAGSQEFTPSRRITGPFWVRFPKCAVCTLRLDFREWDSSFPRPSAWSWQSCCCRVGRKRWTSRRFDQAGSPRAI